MAQAILHLGSNIGDRAGFIKNAIKAIARAVGAIKDQSKWYETAAWGLEDQADFLNCCLLVETELSPFAVLETIKSIEIELGRKKRDKWTAREIDIDIIFYNLEVLQTESLTIPHPEMANRNFVLIPLLDIAGDWIHPILNKDVETLYVECTDTQEVILLDEEVE